MPRARILYPMNQYIEAKYPQFPVHLYNSLTREKERFQPINPPAVGMYVCGPTVYGDPHLGHGRSAIIFDVVFRYLNFLGYKVRYVRNITDVGHMENEVDETGEDKIEKKARLHQLEPMEVAQHYTNVYRSYMAQLNVLPPSIEPTASGHIIEQIQVIRKIIDNGFAYVINGSVYFDVQTYAAQYPYGELSGKVLEDLQANTRTLQGQDEKKSPFDFALWKKAKPEHIMKWESPWSLGFPGWHLECTAMSSKYLGIPFDLHGGGQDLKFPHHEGEIAQSISAFGCEPVNYWMHNNMLTINGQKMSKSLGNFITLEQLFSGNHELLEKSYSPMTMRFFILQAHYGSQIDFSNEALQASEKGLARLINSLDYLDKLEDSDSGGQVDMALENEISDMINNCYVYMSDDFNTAKVIASLFELSAKINAFYHQQLPLSAISPETLEALRNTFKGFITDVLGLRSVSTPSVFTSSEKSNNQHQLDAVVDLLISLRNQARTSRDFATADKIRDDLKAIGIQLKDEKSGQTSFSMIH